MVLGFGLKNSVRLGSFGMMGKKVQNQIALGKKNHNGRKINNGIQITNRAIQTLRPLERVPIIGVPVKIVTGVSGASANISGFAQGQIDKGRDFRRERRGNDLEVTGPPPIKAPDDIFV